MVKPTIRRIGLLAGAATVLAAPQVQAAEAPIPVSMSAFPKAPQAPAGAPNVIVIMTDDVGFAASSTFGGPIPTPTFDALAANGLRFNRFHTTALCSPTRAALLTGRNHHAVNTGVISELATGRPGYTGVIPDDAITFGQVLKDNGYVTAFIGKNHNTPDWETGPAGPFTRWPTGWGFDYFFGFNGGETNQWAPALVENTTTIEPPTNDPAYILDHDMADRTINWLRAQNSAAPGKPFLVYYAPGTAHAPHHAPREWIDRYRGQFAQGWDRMREESLARQKKQGVVPADTKLTPRPAGIPAWDSLSPEQKRLYSRMMEVYAGALSYADNQIGRVIDEVRRQGKLDNTLILYIQGDNGASAEGGLSGTTNELAALLGNFEPFEYTYSKIDTLGGPLAFNHYPAGWAWAMDTPFQWTKQIASHLGGTRNGMVVSWPARIKGTGQVRSQFTHVIDVAPTLYEAIGIRLPQAHNGVTVAPLDGRSFAASFTARDTPSPREVQYFEMFGNRAIYDHGWMAGTTPERMPWVPGAEVDAQTFKWELYNLDKDFSQANDLAAANPQKLAELKARFEEEGERNHVLPVQASVLNRLAGGNRPSLFAGLSKVRLLPNDVRYTNGAFPDIRNRSWKLSAVLNVPQESASGAVVTQGGRFGGWGLLLLNGRPTFVYRRTNLPTDLFRLDAAQALPPGPHRIDLAFTYAGGGAGRGGELVMQVDGQPAGSIAIPRTATGWPLEGATIGWDAGTPLLEDYRVPFPLKGVEHVDIELAPPGMGPAAPARPAGATAP